MYKSLTAWRLHRYAADAVGFGPQAVLERLYASSRFPPGSHSIVANAIAADPILHAGTASPMEQLAHTAGWQIEAPRANIRGLDAVDTLFSIPLLRSEHSL